MAFTWKLNARYATAKPIFGIVASAGIDAKVVDAEPGMQDVILARNRSSRLHHGGSQ